MQHHLGRPQASSKKQCLNKLNKYIYIFYISQKNILLHAYTLYIYLYKYIQVFYVYFSKEYTFCYMCIHNFPGQIQKRNNAVIWQRQIWVVVGRRFYFYFPYGLNFITRYIYQSNLKKRVFCKVRFCTTFVFFIFMHSNKRVC